MADADKSEAADLLRLAAEVEAQQEPSRVMNALVARALTGRCLVSPADRATDENIEYWANVDQLPHFTASIDATMDLFHSVKTRFVMTGMQQFGDRWVVTMAENYSLLAASFTVTAKTLAMALIAALLAAKAKTQARG